MDEYIFLASMLILTFLDISDTCIISPERYAAGTIMLACICIVSILSKILKELRK
jgi:hypothetical protein